GLEKVLLLFCEERGKIMKTCTEAVSFESCPLRSKNLILNQPRCIMEKSRSLEIAKRYLGEKVRVVFDRPLGTKHPKHGFVYEANYGYIPGIKAPDGEDLDTYYLGIDEPLQKAEGFCIAIIHRENDDDDKLVVAPENVELSDEEILKATAFQEQWFKSRVIRKP
ncbi:MAG: hypothetical protein ACQESA_01970, partial [Patescibacteria group bacterium]